MAEHPSYPVHNDESEARGRKARRSRWAWVPWVVGLILAATFVVLHLTGVLGAGPHE